MLLVNRSPDDVNITPAFQREGFGRQSMSEKRKGHVDPKSLDLYQKLKHGKDKSSHFAYGAALHVVYRVSVDLYTALLHSGI